MNLSKMKLGRKAVKHDVRTLLMARYFTEALPPPASTADWTGGLTSFGQMLNDSLGCCTIAGCGHATQTWTKAVGLEVTVPDSTILRYYEAWDGYDPNDPSTDQGGVELDVLTDWRKQTFAGVALSAFAAVNPLETDNVKRTIGLFGGAYIGLGLPVTAQTQETWHVVRNGGADAEPGSWGGHCVWVAGYDAEGLTVITWGALKRMTWNFWNKYVDEAYGLISTSFINPSGVSPSGFNFEQLSLDLQQVTS